jgi:hypothetical protein
VEAYRSAETSRRRISRDAKSTFSFLNFLTTTSLSRYMARYVSDVFVVWNFSKSWIDDFAVSMFDESSCYIL